MSVSINITADSRGVLRAIASTTAAMQKLDAAAKSNEGAITRSGRASSVFASMIDRLSGSEARRAAGLARVRTAQDEMERSASSTASAYNRLTGSVDRSASAIGRAILGGSVIRTSVGFGITAMEEYAKVNDVAAASLDKVSAAVARFKADIGRDLTGSGDGIAEYIDSIGKDRGAFTNDMARVFRFLGVGGDGTPEQIDALRRVEERQTAEARRIKDINDQRKTLEAANQAGAFAPGEGRDIATLLNQQNSALAAVKGDDSIAENLRLQIRIRYSQQLNDIYTRQAEAMQKQQEAVEASVEAEKERAREAQATLEAQRERIELGTRESQVERLRMLGDERGALIAQNRLDFLRKESEIGGMNLPAQDAMAALNSLKTESDATLRIELASFDANAIANASRNATVRNVQTGLFGLGGELAGNALAGGGGAAQAAANAARTAANTAEAAALLKDIKAGIENSGAVWAP
ncbi:MAG: hypothetical protein ACK5X3_10015 [Pseudomonadota bacterium]